MVTHAVGKVKSLRAMPNQEVGYRAYAGPH